MHTQGFLTPLLGEGTARLSNKLVRSGPNYYPKECHLCRVWGLLRVNSPVNTACSHLWVHQLKQILARLPGQWIHLIQRGCCQCFQGILIKVEKFSSAAARASTALPSTETRPLNCTVNFLAHRGFTGRVLHPTATIHCRWESHICVRNTIWSPLSGPFSSEQKRRGLDLRNRKRALIPWPRTPWTWWPGKAMNI